MNENVRLKRVCPGFYTAMVKGRGSGYEPFLIEVKQNLPFSDWCVISDTERFFFSFKQAKAYVNRFFESAKENQ